MRTRPHIAIVLFLVAGGCEGALVADSPDTSFFPDVAVDVVLPDASASDAGSAVDGSSFSDARVRDAVSDTTTDVGAAWEDPTRTHDPESLAQIAPYEAQFWGALDAFEERVRMSMLDGPYTDQSARDASYSSSIGHGVYHALDDLVAMTHVMEATDDRRHKERYAEVAVGMLDIIIPAVAEGQGTAGCSDERSIYRCAPGRFRYLDAGHGLGAAGFMMNAIYEDPELRVVYAERLQAWAEAMVPELDRLESVTREPSLGSDITLRNPHMPSKVIVGYLAAGKILERADYLDAFERVVRHLVAAIDHNQPTGWIGSDVSHALITTAVAFAAYREQLRGNLPIIIRNGHLRGIGETFEEARERYDYSHGGERDYDVGAHAATLRHSPSIRSLVVDDYEVPPTGRVSAVAHGWRYGTLGGIAIGFATRIQVED